MEKEELFTKALGKVKNRYLLVDILSKRIRQLKDELTGSADLDFRTALVIALNDVIEGKISAELFIDDKKEKGNKAAE